MTERGSRKGAERDQEGSKDGTEMEQKAWERGYELVECGVYRNRKMIDEK